MTEQKIQSPIGEITRIALTNNNGAEVVLSSLGAGIVSIKVPDAKGVMADVALGYKDLTDYIADGPCAGKTPGRYANRIAKGIFYINGNKYELPVNNGPNHLHGGPDGFQNKIWQCVELKNNSVTFALESTNGDSGYPATLKATVKYTWTDDNTLQIDYNATADAPTVINLTNHTYFNLNGHNSGSSLGHILTLDCSKWLPTDNTLIPNGEFADVEGTPMDFITPHCLGERIHQDFPALNYGKGYDNCWIADVFDGKMHRIATLHARESGRTLIVETNQPAVQVYTGNWLSGSPMGKDNYEYHDYDAVAIECQGCPDAPNHPEFPSQTLNPGETYTRSIRYIFKA